MQILITGAAGNVGRATVHAAHDAGHTVVATDTVFHPGLPVRLHLADLCDFRPIYPLLEGCDAVIHVANHPHRGAVRPDQRLLAENLAMSANAFTAAVEMGVTRLCFASSIQAAASNPVVIPAEGNGTGDDGVSGGRPEVKLPPYLPLDGAMPRDPGTNPYAQSKAFAEEVLERFAAADAGLRAVVMRLPWVMKPKHAEHFGRRGRRHGSPLRWALSHLHEGWAYLHQSDAAAALLAGVTASHPGFRTYYPARSYRSADLDLEAMLAEYAADLPRRKPLPGEGLIDIGPLTRDLGWTPRQPPVVLPPVMQPASSTA